MSKKVDITLNVVACTIAFAVVFAMSLVGFSVARDFLLNQFNKTQKPVSFYSEYLNNFGK